VIGQAGFPVGDRGLRRIDPRHVIRELRAQRLDFPLPHQNACVPRVGAMETDRPASELMSFAIHQYRTRRECKPIHQPRDAIHGMVAPQPVLDECPDPGIPVADLACERRQSGIGQIGRRLAAGKHGELRCGRILQQRLDRLRVRKLQ